MALSRKLLEEMGLEDAQISKVVTAHRETVDGLKEEIKTYEKQVADLEASKRELEGKITKAESKFEKEHSDFEDYKKSQAEKDTTASKEKAYKELLKKANVSDKRIDAVLKVTDIKSLEVDENGKFKNEDELLDSIKDEWADFIVSTEKRGAETSKPNGNDGGSKKTKEEIDAIKDTEARQKAMLENAELYGIE